MIKYVASLYLILCGNLLGAAFLSAQTPQPASTHVLTLEEVYNYVLEYHPLAKRAALLGDIAQSELRRARGNFDPSLDIHWNQKTLQGVSYYTNWNNFVKVPTWWGMEIKGGYERYVGINVNPENFTPDDGLIYLEFTVPLASGLLYDMRRNILQQARLMPQMNEQQRLKLMNKLLLDVAKDYWEWYYAWQTLQVYTEAEKFAEERLGFVQQAVRGGEQAPIDTVEARLELIDRQVLLGESEVRFRNATLLLSNHLWDAAGQPLVLNEGITPLTTQLNVRLPEAQLRDSLEQWAREQHPEIKRLEFRVMQTEFDRKYYRQALLPEISVDIKPFVTPGDNVFESQDFYFKNNFKVGFNFYTPLFLRRERGDYELAKIRMRSAELDLEQIRREIVNHNKAAWNDLETFVRLVTMQNRALDYAGRLLEASRQMYEGGEGSLFLVNNYERKLISEQTKMAELQGKYAKSLASWYWSTGVPLEQLRF